MDEEERFQTKYQSEWKCPKCGWTEKAHPKYGWASHNERAVEVHKTMLCPIRTKP